MSDGETVTYETPCLARIWKEGKRVFEDSVIAVECDGKTITVTTDDGEDEYLEDEWDELTVEYI